MPYTWLNFNTSNVNNKPFLLIHLSFGIKYFNTSNVNNKLLMTALAN